MRINGLNGVDNAFAVHTDSLNADRQKNVRTEEKRYDAVKVSITDEGIQSYKDSMNKGNEDISGGVILTDYGTMLSSRLPSIYGEKNADGEYERNYRSVGEKANDLLNSYASIYDEIIQGYEDGTREIYIADETSESGYRKLSKDEELDELNKAFKNQSEKFEERNKNNKEAIEILSAHAEKVSKLSSGRASIAKDAQK